MGAAADFNGALLGGVVAIEDGHGIEAFPHLGQGFQVRAGVQSRFQARQKIRTVAGEIVAVVGRQNLAINDRAGFRRLVSAGLVSGCWLLRAGARGAALVSVIAAA